MFLKLIVLFLFYLYKIKNVKKKKNTIKKKKTLNKSIKF